jgi:predicted ATPase
MLASAVEGFPPTRQFPELTDAPALLAALSESDAVKSAAALSQRRLRLQTSLGNALIWAKGQQAPETSAAFARARELARREEDASERFSAYHGLWVGHLNRCEPALMREMAELFLREAASRPDCVEAVVAHRISGVTCLYLATFPAPMSIFRRPSSSTTSRAMQISPPGSALADRALADAESAAHAPTMGVVLAVAALLGLIRCNPEAVATYSQALGDIASRYDLPAFFSGSAVFFQGWAKWSDVAEASRLAEMRRGLAIEQEQGKVWLLPGFKAAVAEGEASAGETDAGLRRLDAALAELERTDQRWYEAEMHRIRAEILLKRGPADTAAAEQSLHAAIAIAQSQKARSFELRAALALAKLYRSTNHDADAHAVLAPAVEGFPPTQQFPELTEAQSLLAALSL